MKKPSRAPVILALFLLVPFLIGNIMARVLDAIDPPRRVEQKLGLIEGVKRARAKTRLTLGVIGVYYVALVSGWIVLRRKKPEALPSPES